MSQVEYIVHCLVRHYSLITCPSIYLYLSTCLSVSICIWLLVQCPRRRVNNTLPDKARRAAGV